MFGNKEYVTEQRVTEMVQSFEKRICQLEHQMEEQTGLISELQRALAEQSSHVAVSADTEADAPTKQPLSPVSSATDIEIQSTASALPETLYFSMPTADGVFLESTASEVVGKSIYRLSTDDGSNGRFVMLSTPDAIATAMISVSQFVKPVCRIEGNTRRQPQRIETLVEGVAQREGTAWRVVTKATVEFV